METKKGLIVLLALGMLAGTVDARSIRYIPPTDQPAPTAGSSSGGSRSNVGLIIGTVVITALIAYVGHKVYKRAQRRARLLPRGEV